MAKAHRYFIGAGCLLLVFGAVIFALLVKGLSAPSLPRQMVLTLRLAGPIAEVTADDPLAEMMGDQATSLRKVREALVRAAEDDRVQGVRLRVDSIGGGFATAQELRSLISRVNAAGKWTAAYLDTAGEFTPGNTVYYVASACDEVVMNPQGDLNLIGLSAATPFIRGTFDKLEIRPEFMGRGDYKTARFMYTQKDFTPAHREMLSWILDSLMEQVSRGIANSRGMQEEEILNLIDQGPFIGEESVAAGLVDRMEDWTSFVDRLNEEHGEAKAVSVRSYLKRAGKSRGGEKIAVVTAVGTILRGSSGESFNPLVGGPVMGSDTIAKAFRDVRKTNGVKAVVGDHSERDGANGRGRSCGGVDVQSGCVGRLLDQLRSPAHCCRPWDAHRVDRRVYGASQLHRLLQ
jgi:protease-4